MTYFDDVKEFHQKFNLPNSEYPTELSDNDLMKRLGYIIEEISEILKKDNRELASVIDGLLDAAYFIFGTFVEMGIDPLPFWNIIHKANMDKVWPNGGVNRDKNGKVIKPLNWQDPKIEIQKQIDLLFDDYKVFCEGCGEYHMPKRATNAYGGYTVCNNCWKQLKKHV